jgi:hypothetical protein
VDFFTYIYYVINDTAMEIKHLINETYQIVNEDSVLLQGTYDDCLQYMADDLLIRIKTNPELLDVFKRLADK